MKIHPKVDGVVVAKLTTSKPETAYYCNPKPEINDARVRKRQVESDNLDK